MTAYGATTGTGRSGTGRAELDDLLVVTDSDDGPRACLGLPFRDATVIELNAPDRPGIHGRFDRAVIDLRSYDPTVIDAVAGALRPGGEIVLVVPPAFDPAAIPAPATRLSFTGVTTTGGDRVGVVLSLPDGGGGAPPEQTLACVAAAGGGFQVAAERLSRSRAGIDETRAALRLERELRQQSENALMDQIEALLRELERHRGIRLAKTVALRHRSGRMAIRLLRPAARALRGTRRRATGARSRLSIRRFRG